MNKLKNGQRSAKTIVGGLMYFYFCKEAQNIGLNIDIKDDHIEIEATGEVKLSSTDLKKLEILKKPVRLPEFEGYYEVLIDDNDKLSDVFNIDGLSSIIDSSEVNYDGNVLNLKLRRNL